MSVTADEGTRAVLRAITRDHGTPAYAYDLRTLEWRWRTLRSALPPSVGVLYSVKANPSVGICSLLAGWGAGADVASAGELDVALAAGFSPDDILVASPYKGPDMIRMLRSLPRVVLSIDSLSELSALPGDLPCPLVLRLRPDFASPAALPAGDRFGIPLDELRRSRDLGAYRDRIVGFHLHSGTQVLDAHRCARQLRDTYELIVRAADVVGVEPRFVGLGGGFGFPYGRDDRPLDLGVVAAEVARVVEEVPDARVVLELGRYIVADSGWYLTTVVAHQRRNRRAAVVVDGGTHHLCDMCELDLARRSHPPLPLCGVGAGSPRDTDVLGCLCLPGDVLSHAAPLPPLVLGAVLAFPNCGAYGLTAAAGRFLSHPTPPEIAFDDASTYVLRPRGRPADAVEGQQAAPFTPAARAGRSVEAVPS